MEICKKCNGILLNVEYARYPGPLIQKAVVCMGCGLKVILR